MLFLWSLKFQSFTDSFGSTTAIWIVCLHTVLLSQLLSYTIWTVSYRLEYQTLEHVIFYI